MIGDARGQRTLEVAEDVVRLLAAEGVETAIIGAIALAVYGYPRATLDLDLAVVADPFTTLRAVTDRLRAGGYDAALTEPDAADPLGGVVNVSGTDFDRVQIVNFWNPLRPRANPGVEAVAAAVPIAGRPGLRVVGIPYLVALKLYAGGLKSRLDVAELLERNQPLDLREVRRVCASFGLADALEAILREMRPHEEGGRRDAEI